MQSNQTKTARRESKNLNIRLIFACVTLVALVTPAARAYEPALLFYAMENGDVRAMNMETGADNGVAVPANAFFDPATNPGTTRNIAYDSSTGLLWYSASDNNVHSVTVSTLAAGPTISDVNDAFYGDMRTLAIDQYSHRLYISTSFGSVAVYELSTNTWMYTIPVSAFGLSEPNPGNRRRLCADAYGDLWYAAADGTFKEFDPAQAYPHFTGRVIPVSQQIEPGNPGQQRSFVAARMQSGANRLYYAATDGTVRTADLDTLTNVTITYFASWFLTSTNPGALRTLAIDPTWTAPGSPPASPTGMTASDGTYPDLVWLNWDAVANADYYWVNRRDLGTQTWTRVIFSYWMLFDDQNVVPGQIYEYTVEACNQWGCSDLSTDTDTGYAGGLTPPTGLTASHGTFPDRVRLSWDPVAGAGGYVLSVFPPTGLPYTTWVSGTTYDHMDALPFGSHWQYSVAACTNPSDCSAGSPLVWGWMGDAIFSDGFDSGNLGAWSAVAN